VQPNMLDGFSSIFSGLPQALAEAIRAHGTLVKSRRGNDVVAAGDTSNQVYLLLEGRVQIRLLMHSGTEAILRDLNPGDFFGELAALDDGPRSAWAVALSDCVLARISGEAFRALVTEVPAAATWMQQRLVAQIRDLTHRWFELNVLQVRSRLHCELARMCGASEDSVILDPAPSHAELAARIGTHREAVTREIGFLSRSGILEQEGKRRRLTIRDPNALRRLAETATWGA
jgi:CRP/FNR family transcriptional regulator, cyclic AMP receptor protein